MLSVKQGNIKYHFFLVFGMTQPAIELWFPGPLNQYNYLVSNQILDVIPIVDGRLQNHCFPMSTHKRITLALV